MAVVIPANINQPVREVVPENGTDFKLSQMDKLLSCDTVQMLPIAVGLIMVISVTF
jgi:hypothetical protein